MRTTTMRLATLIETLQAGVLVEDEKGRIVFANQHFCTLFNLKQTSHELLGNDCLCFAAQLQDVWLKPDDVVARIERLLSERQSVVGEELLLVDGRTLECDYIPIFLDADYRGHL